jgi:ABC-type transport system involved in multi-copper enzyme maturation permease subunit
MSVTTYQRPAERVVSGLSFARILKSELIKFRSLRSTWITYAVALLVADGLGVLVAALRGNDIHNHPGGDIIDPVAFTLHGIFLAQLAIGVVGVLYITGEYATGSIRATMTAVPKRMPVLLAKTGIFAAITAVVALAMTFIAFFAGQAVLSTWNLNVGLGHSGALRAVTGSALYLVCVGLMGLGFGFALRNTGGAIASLFGVVLVLPLIVQSLPQSWQDNINKFLPLSIADHMMSTRVDIGSHALSNGMGAVMLVIYAVASLAIGLVVLKRRDV